MTNPTPMTNEEILAVQKLVSGIQVDLLNIHICTVGRLDEPELVARVLKAAPRMFDSFNQLLSYRPTIFESESDRDTVYDGLHEIFFRSTQPQEIQSWMRDRVYARTGTPAWKKAVAELAELMTRQPEYKKKLVDTVKTQVDRVRPVLAENYDVLEALWVDAPMTNEEILEAEKLIAGIRNDLTVLTGGLLIMMALAEMAERRPDYKMKLLDAVAKQAPIVEAILDKTVQTLRELRPPCTQIVG